MKKRMIGMAVVGLAGLVGSSALAATPSPYQRPGHTERVSVASNGAQASYPAVSTGGGYDCDQGTALSADGRYAVFVSEATNLVPGDTNLVCDVFVRDRINGSTTRVSVASDGSQSLAPPTGSGTAALAPSISADGRYVAFSSSAINLVPGDTNNQGDTFIHDMKTKRTWRALAVITRTGGVLSADGRHMVYETFDKAHLYQSYVLDLRTGKSSLASRSSTGASADKGAFESSISADGRYVAFTSAATNLVPGNTLAESCRCAGEDVYWHDMKTGKTIRISVASDGAQASYATFPNCVIGTPALIPLPDDVAGFGLGLGGGTQLCYSRTARWGAISDDGRYVTFESTATNLVPNDTNFTPPAGGYDIFVHDVLTRRTERISVNSSGEQLPSYMMGFATTNSNGRYVAYQNVAARPGEVCPEGAVSLLGVPLAIAGKDVPCGSQEINRYDRLTGAIELVTAATNGGLGKRGACTSLDHTLGQAGAAAWNQAMSADGRYTTFFASQSDLVAGDTNDHCDRFVRDSGPALGVGATGQPSGATGSQPDCLTGVICSATDPSELPADAAGADLTAARLVRRAAAGDLFLRWDLRRLPSLGAPGGGVVYGMSFTANGSHFQVRAQRLPGLDYDAAGGASFGLFRESPPGGWTRVATLKGGYGTVGDAVVTAVPISALGGSAQLTEVTAFTAVGSYLSGPTKVLDSLKLSR